MKLWELNFYKGTHKSVLEGVEDFTHLHLAAVSTIVAANTDKDLATVLGKGTVICDSSPLHFVLSYFGVNTPHIRGTDFMRAVLKSEIPRNHVIIGSSTENLIMVEKLFKSRYKNQNLVSSFSPSLGFHLSEILDYVYALKTNENTLFWIALGSPLQDHIAAKVFEKIQHPTIAIGAALDFLTGNIKESPKVLQYHGLEWVYRLYAEPKRLWKRYLLGNLIFVRLVLFQLIQYRIREVWKNE
jgi:N-acetylglucosaminyldiphosphoundecaprenol N-acetyl-beta-D-mannosaminyltransferase